MEKDIFFERLRPWANMSFNQIIISALGSKRALYATIKGIDSPPHLFIRALEAYEDEGKIILDYQKALADFYSAPKKSKKK
ncbi:hypothetical protein [Pantoea agglomerans]|uniref:hypothetical protein n=1 Tax=Enterobacter agglomerans TaxID=549 RepID=UPI0030165539